MKVLFLINHVVSIYNYRKELVDALLEQNAEVVISCPAADERLTYFEKKGVQLDISPLNRHSLNPFAELLVFRYYWRLIRRVKPDVVLLYTIKPNIYGGVLCRFLKVPYLITITGLGNAIAGGGLLQKLVMILYRLATKKASCLFFQNLSNQKFFLSRRAASAHYRLTAGSGVNLEEHALEPYPSEKDGIRLLYVGRIMRTKGIGELIAAARNIRKTDSRVHFQAIGFCEPDFAEELSHIEGRDEVQMFGHKNNVDDYIREAHAVILPSYHEGMANGLLEGAAKGRAILASDIPGCRESFTEGVSGFGFKPGDEGSLEAAVRKFLALTPEEREKMGLEGRKKMEHEFDRNAVVQAYMEEIAAAVKGDKTEEKQR